MEFNKKVFGPSQVIQTVYALHPFQSEYVYQFFIYDRDVDVIVKLGKSTLPQWKLNIKDAIFDNVPGVDCVVIANGSLTIIHCCVLSLDEINSVVEGIVDPYLNEQIRTKMEASIKNQKEQKVFQDLAANFGSSALQAIDSL